MLTPATRGAVVVTSAAPLVLLAGVGTARVRVYESSGVRIRGGDRGWNCVWSRGCIVIAQLYYECFAWTHTHTDIIHTRIIRKIISTRTSLTYVFIFTTTHHWIFQSLSNTYYIAIRFTLVSNKIQISAYNYCST